MVICDGALVVNLVASIMMNGVCCIHSMHEEEEKRREHRETLQKTLHVEWQRQRLFEEELREQQEKSQANAHERRKSLMAAKMKASSSASSRSLVDQYHEHHGDSSVSSTTRTPKKSNQTKRPSEPPYQLVKSPSMVMAQRRIRSAPVTRRSNNCFPRLPPGGVPRRGYESDISLFDSDDEDGNSFEDVALV